MSETRTFSLEYSGTPVPCDFPRCVLHAFHDGDHEFARAVPVASGPHYFTCTECGGKFVVYGQRIPGQRNVCDSQECLLSMCRREAVKIPLLCACPQRPFPHELSVHQHLRSESYNPRLKYRWPWSLALSERLELSAEGKRAA